jgi:GNAT superfamily N-acetyltransferase
MGDATIRRAAVGDALIVAALHLQYARELGLPPERGFLDRVADAWLADLASRPTWIAERAGEHAGLLETSRVRRLPWPGRPDASWLHVDALFVAPGHRGHGVGRALVEAMVDWARETDVRFVRLDAPEDDARRFHSHLGFTSPRRLMELDLRMPE